MTLIFLFFIYIYMCFALLTVGSYLGKLTKGEKMYPVDWFVISIITSMALIFCYHLGFKSGQLLKEKRTLTTTEVDDADLWKYGKLEEEEEE